MRFSQKEHKIMAMTFRPWIAVVTLLSLTAGTVAAESAPRLEKQKLHAVQRAISEFGLSGEEVNASQVASEACTLHSIGLRSEGELPTLVLHLDGSPAFAVDADGTTLTIDFQGTIPLSTGKAPFTLPAPLVSLQTEMTNLTPALATRVVLVFSAPVTYTATKQGQDTLLDLSVGSKTGVANPLRLLLLMSEAGRQQAQPEFAVEKSFDARTATMVAQIESLRQKEELPSRELPLESASPTEEMVLQMKALRASRVESLAYTRPLEGPSPKVRQIAQQLRSVSSQPFDLRQTHFILDAMQNAEEDTASGETADDTVTEEAEDAPVEDAPVEEDDTQESTEVVEVVEEIPMPQPPVKRLQVELAGAESTSSIISKRKELEEETEVASVASPARPRPMKGDPLTQIVNIDFREMELINVVAILANKAGINVVAGAELTGTVTANLKNVTLRQAMETALRTNGLGMVEEAGIYNIVTYEEAVAAQRTTEMIALSNAKAKEVETVLTDVMKGAPDQSRVSISANPTSNVIVIAGPKHVTNQLLQLARELDISEPVLPTVTEPIKLNYADPDELELMLEKMLTPEIGSVASDARGRHIVITDVPVVVEQIRELIKQLDVAVKQVVIDAMVVDAVLEDNADTGVQWLVQAVQNQSRRQAALGPDAANTGDLQALGLATDMLVGRTAASILNFGVLTGDIDWNGIIQAEIRNQNGHLVSNPVIVAVENEEARISISQEIPFVELKQTGAGGSQTTTEFKEVGTVLTVTPQVTHDNHIMAKISGKESGTAGEFNGIPIEDKREIETSLRVNNGQTIFIGGLRKRDNDATIRKVPILGDIPVINFAFRSNQRREQTNELLIFLTCSVLDDELPELTPYQRAQHQTGRNIPNEVNAEQSLFHDALYPGEMREPVWRYRSPK